MEEEIVQQLHVQALQNRFCDVTIHVHGKTYGAHRGVLVQASPYFEKMFSGSFRESQTGYVSFSKLFDNVELFEEVLKYLYLRKFDLLAHDTEAVLAVSTHMLLKDLVDDCHQHLLERLTVDNALYTWALATLYSLTQLEAVCKAFVRCHFRATLQHKTKTQHADTAFELPISWLSYFLKQGMLDNMSSTEKLQFLQQWLQKMLRKCLLGKLPIPFNKIRQELAEAEPGLSDVLHGQDFLTKRLRIKDAGNETVDCILKFDSSEYMVHCGDLDHGQWYQSSKFAVPESEYFKQSPDYIIGAVGRFFLVKSNSSTKLLALDSVNNTSHWVLPPTSCIEGSLHIFGLGNSVLCIAAVTDSHVPSDDCSTHNKKSDVTESASDGSGQFEKHVPSAQRVYRDEADSLNQPSTSSSMDGSVDPGKLDDQQQELIHLNKDWWDFVRNVDLTYYRYYGGSKDMPPIHASPVSNTAGDATDIDIDNLTIVGMDSGNNSVKHCLFHLRVICNCEPQPSTSKSTIPPMVCQTCPLSWSFVSEFEIQGKTLNTVLDNYRWIELEGMHCIMAFGVERCIPLNTNQQGQTSNTQAMSDKSGPFVFRVKQVNGDMGKFYIVDTLPPVPDRRRKTSRPIDWERINFVTIQGCIGLRSTKAVMKYCICFDAKDWRWKWLPFRVKNGDNPCRVNTIPKPITLPIKRKSSCKFESSDIHGLSTNEVRYYNSYPDIIQLWRFDTPSEKWKDLSPPPQRLPKFGWRRHKLPLSILGYLHPTQYQIGTEGKKIMLEEEVFGPFADFKIMAV